MRNRLPVYIEDLELPKDELKHEEHRGNSYGYVNILQILSLMITLGSILTVIFLGNR